MAFLFFLFWIGARAWERFANPQILSEDGKVFVTQAYAEGLASLGHVYAGYFHTLPRLIALVATRFPVEWLPLMLTLPCYLLFVQLLARLVRADFSELLPTRTERWCAAFLLSMAPGLFEVFGNPTNIHWVLTLYLGLLCLRNLDQKLGPWDLVLGTLAVASGGEVLVLLPLFAWRWRYARQGKKTELYFLALILLFSGLNILGRESGPGLGFRFLAKLPSGLTYLWNNWILLQPLVGDHATHWLGRSAAGLYWAVVVGLSILLGFRAWKKRALWRQPRAQLLGLFFLAFVSLVAMVWVARDEAFGIFNQITRDAGYSALRYSFLLGGPVLLFHLKIWPALFPRLHPRSWALLFTSFTFLVSVHRFFWTAHEPKQPSWTQRLEALPEGCPDPVSIEIWPENWTVQIPQSELKKHCR